MDYEAAGAAFLRRGKCALPSLKSLSEVPARALLKLLKILKILIPAVSRARLAEGDCGVARACAGVVATSHFAESAFGEANRVLIAQAGMWLAGK